MIRRLLGSLIPLSLLTACAVSAPAGPKISIENAWARPAVVGPMSATPEMQGMAGMSGSETPEMPGMPGGGTNSAAYFTILNLGSEADTLVGASTDVATKAEVHETRIQGDVAEMVPVARVDVPAGGRIEFKPGGYHVMLIGLRQDLKEGDTLSLTLQFEKSGAITLNVPIRLEN